mgnify:CR=1 FL=1
MAEHSPETIVDPQLEQLKGGMKQLTMFCLNLFFLWLIVIVVNFKEQSPSTHQKPLSTHSLSNSKGGMKPNFCLALMNS